MYTPPANGVKLTSNTLAECEIRMQKATRAANTGKGTKQNVSSLYPAHDQNTTPYERIAEFYVNCKAAIMPVPNANKENWRDANWQRVTPSLADFESHYNGQSVVVGIVPKNLIALDVDYFIPNRELKKIVARAARDGVHMFTSPSTSRRGVHIYIPLAKGSSDTLGIDSLRALAKDIAKRYRLDIDCVYPSDRVLTCIGFNGIMPVNKDGVSLLDATDNMRLDCNKWLASQDVIAAARDIFNQSRANSVLKNQPKTQSMTAKLNSQRAKNVLTKHFTDTRMARWNAASVRLGDNWLIKHDATDASVWQYKHKKPITPARPQDDSQNEQMRARLTPLQKPFEGTYTPHMNAPRDVWLPSFVGGYGGTLAQAKNALAAAKTWNAAKVALAKNYPMKAGYRHDLILLFASLAIRFNVSHDDCNKVVAMVCRQASDNDVRDRLRAVSTTYKRAATGKKLSGIDNRHAPVTLFEATSWGCDLRQLPSSERTNERKRRVLLAIGKISPSQNTARRTSCRSLSEMTGIDKSTCAKTLNELVVEGLIKKDKASSWITPKGIKTLKIVSVRDAQYVSGTALLQRDDSERLRLANYRYKHSLQRAVYRVARSQRDGDAKYLPPPARYEPIQRAA